MRKTRKFSCILDTLIFSKMNLLIKRGLPNLLALTLQELCSPDLSNNFLFRFTNDQGKQQILAKIPVTYSNSRYDLFTMVEGTDVTFPHTGDYMYEVFQMPDDVSEDPADGIRVEVGKVEFEDDPTALPAPTINNEIVTYDPNENAS